MGYIKRLIIFSKRFKIKLPKINIHLPDLFHPLTNLWFILSIITLLAIAMYDAADYFNWPQQEQIESYFMEILWLMGISLFILLVSTFIFIRRIYKKYLEVTLNDKEKQKYYFYTRRLITFVLLLILLILVDVMTEELTRDKEKDIIIESQRAYCEKTEMDESTTDYKEIFDHIKTQTNKAPRQRDLARVLPCVVIKKVDFYKDTGINAFASFDINNAERNYLPINIDVNLDTSDVLISSIVLSRELFMARDFVNEQENPDGKKASCLQRFVNGYDEQSLFMLGEMGSKDTFTGELFLTGEYFNKLRDLYYDNEINMSKNQEGQLGAIMRLYNDFYLPVFTTCEKEVGEILTEKYFDCTTALKIKNIEDFVYGTQAFRDYCAYR
jgi:hypothetical protein